MPSETTLPKPFVFVLMPFDQRFEDIYKFGIKGAADDVGAYAERVDEQVFGEGILDRIFNQISKADVVVADMTGRNPNVFYEVGYAHALGKIVLLLTQNSDDIPFDLKHRQHTVYGGKIETLRRDLAVKLQWAISEGRRRLQSRLPESFSIRLLKHSVSRGVNPEHVTAIKGDVRQSFFYLPMDLRNDSDETLLGITHVYLFAEPNAALIPCEVTTIPITKLTAGPSLLPKKKGTPLDAFVANPIDAPDGLIHQYRLRTRFPSLPPGAVEQSGFNMMFRGGETNAEGRYRLRLHSPREYHDFSFSLAIDLKLPIAPEQSSASTSTPEPAKIAPGTALRRRAVRLKK